MLDRTPEFAPADPMPPDIAALRDSVEPVWIFAYGSLMWDPDFPHAKRETALLRGYHRSFCLYSYDYRGTRERPGLTLGLDRGGACRGIVLRLPPEALAGADRMRQWEGLCLHGAPRPSGLRRAVVARRDRPDHRRCGRPPRRLPRLSRRHRAPSRRARAHR